MFGPGKYDRQCSEIRLDMEAQGVLLIVFEGIHGTGFSAQLPKNVIANIPEILRKVADEIEKDAKK